MRRIRIPGHSAAPQLHTRFHLRHIRVLPRFWRFVILLLVLIFGACAGASELKYRRCCVHLAEVERARDAAAQRVAALNDRLAEVQTDAYTERIAREELNLLYPGEIRYVAR